MTSQESQGATPPTAEWRGVRLIHRNQGRPRIWTAVPAVAVGVAGLLLAIAMWTGAGSGGIRARYETDAALALSAGDYPTARVCFERLLQLDPNDSHSQFGLALSLRGMGQQVALPRAAEPSGSGRP